MKVNLKCLIFLFSLGFVVSLQPAVAQDTKGVSPEQQAAADELIQKAVEHYGAQRYAEAADCFAQAYEILKEPELLFNVARSYEKLADSKQALVWYELFLAAPNTTADLRTRALTSIAQLHREIAAQEALEKVDETPPPEKSEIEPEQAVEPAPEPEKAAETDTAPLADESLSSTDADSKHGPSPLRITSYALLGVGLAGMVTGGVFGGLSLAAKNDFESTDFDQSRVGYREDMTRDALLFDIVFFSGAAFVTVGLSLFVVDVVKHKSETTAKLSESLGTDRKREGGKVKFTPIFSFNNGEMAGGLAGHF